MHSSNTFRIRWCRTRRAQTLRSVKSALTKFNKTGTPIQRCYAFAKIFQHDGPDSSYHRHPLDPSYLCPDDFKVANSTSYKKEDSICTECPKIVNSCSPKHVQQVFDCFAPDGIYFMKELNRLMIWEEARPLGRTMGIL